MPRSLSDLADQVLAEVEQTSAEKQEPPTYASPVAAGLAKLASDLRGHKPASPTYQDLAEFRKRNGL